LISLSFARREGGDQVRPNEAVWKPDCSQSGDKIMRFMMLMIPKGYENATPGAMPDAKAALP
jgi:hypothetical protein